MLVDRPWNQLASASGHCGHIPAALAELRDLSAETRQAARWRIDNHVVLQGELYEGAPWVVRELIKALSQNAHPGRALVYDLLMELALADAPGKVVFDGQQNVPLVAATRTELGQGRVLFERDSTDGDPTVARLATDLLAEMTAWEDQQG